MIDTNVLLDWLLDRDPQRTAVIDKLIANSEELQIPDMALAELVFVLSRHYGLSRDMVAQNVAKILAEPVFNCNRMLFRRVLPDYVKHSALSFIDCCLLQYASLQNVLPLWTSDKKLVNQSLGKAHLLA